MLDGREYLVGIPVSMNLMLIILKLEARLLDSV